jgi:hypothetical protein
MKLLLPAAMRVSLANKLLLVVGNFFGKNECGRAVYKLDQQGLSVEIDQLTQNYRYLPEMDLAAAIPNRSQ